MIDKPLFLHAVHYVEALQGLSLRWLFFFLYIIHLLSIPAQTLPWISLYLCAFQIYEHHPLFLNIEYFPNSGTLNAGCL